MRVASIFFRSLYGVLFFAGLLLVFISIDYRLFNITLVFDLAHIVIVIFNLILMLVGLIVIFILTLIFASLMGIVPGLTISGGLEYQLFQIYLAVINTSLPSSPLTSLLIADPLGFGGRIAGSIAATIVLVLLPVAVLSGLGFLRDGDTKLSITSFIGLQLILAVAIFSGFWPSEPFFLLIQIITLPLSILAGEPFFASTESLMQVNASNPVALLLSPIFTLGFLLYLVLEIAFQTSYALNILEPMAQREDRIKKHLQRIREFVPESNVGTGEETIRSSAVQSKKYDLLAASYLREMVERKVFKRGEQALDEKSSMRLQSYLASLEVTNPQTEETLTALSAMPSARAIAVYIIPTMIFRIVFVIVFSWLVVNPTGIFFGNQGLIQLFFGGAIANSLELYQPEFRTLVIFNMALIVVVLGMLTHWLATRRAELEIAEVERIETIVEFERYADRTPEPGEAEEEGSGSPEEAPG